jgi:predicted glycogen debranching enzyme
MPPPLRPTARPTSPQLLQPASDPQGPAAPGSPVYEPPVAPLHKAEATEWLLTNGLGGFAMGTVAGIPTRRYHGLLVASLRPPVNRIMALSHVAAAIIQQADTPVAQTTELSTFRFHPDVLHPRGDRVLDAFWQDDRGVHWRYAVGTGVHRLNVTLTVHLVRHQPTVILRYVIAPMESGGKIAPKTRLSLRPLLALRDFHALQLRDLARGRFTVETPATATTPSDAHATPLLTVRTGQPGNPQAQATDLIIRSTGQVRAQFARDEQWWNNFLYSIEQSRGYDAIEDLYNPGEITAELPAGTQPVTIELQASLGQQPVADLDQLAQQQAQRLARIFEATRTTLGPAYSRLGPHKDSPYLARIGALVSAADAYVVHRVRPGAMPGAPADRESIIAGYPWFADWGRDTMIALPGLLLTTGRLSEARAVLLTFAGACKDGLIPNVFDDYSGAAHYNTVDASLWFLHAVCRWFRASGDDDTFTRELLPACREIVEKYRDGTVFDIRMDPADGLISCGDYSTQLTWMDAKRDGVVFTPRFGKPVEINALWHSALIELAQACTLRSAAFSATCQQLAQRAGPSLRDKFWNPQDQYLFDVLPASDGQGGGVPDASIRPNALFAVSLPHSPLTQAQQRAVANTARAALFTPHGSRTLAPSHPNYKPRFRGRMFDRDSAYHNGTAWPWLLGPMAEAHLRAEKFSPESLMHAQQLLDPIVSSLQDGCLGQLAEVYDGEDSPGDPQQPGGCPAQAWSVAETLRVYTLIARLQAGSTEE